MADAEITTDGHAEHPGFFRRWFMSTNHKDIGTLYPIFAGCAGLIGGAMAMAMRYQLMTPARPSFGADHQARNTVVTAHGLTMIFFTIMPA